MPEATTHKWLFLTRFRKGTFGWRGSHLAAERVAEALSEIKKAAAVDPVLGADGAVALLRRISPALEHVDSSSGAIGSAVRVAIDVLVGMIAATATDDAKRGKWLEVLWKVIVDDGMGYMDSLGDRWGDLCATQALASQWADRLTPPLLASFADHESRSYFDGSMACFSALLAAGRYEEIFDLIDRSASLWWEYRKWGFRALVAHGKRAEALRYAEASRSINDNGCIACACEELLLQSGLIDEAYRRYGIAANGSYGTYLARFRRLAKKYPIKAPAELLHDLVATTPGDEGKWFAAAKSAGLYVEAVSLVRTSPCDPKTLTRAARDFASKRLEFALACAIAAVRGYAAGYGYEVTTRDVVEAYNHGLRAAELLGRLEEYRGEIVEIVDAGDAFVRTSLRALVPLFHE